MYKKIENVEDLEKFLSMFTRKKLLLLIQMKTWISIKDLVVRSIISPGDLNDDLRLMEELSLVKVRLRRYGDTTIKEYMMDAVLIVNLYNMKP